MAFTDTRASAQLCQPEGSNGTSCGQPSGTNLAPFFMTETSGNAWSWLTGGATGEPAALVLIGHAGDARQWQCTAATQAECASAFVVDRIAWAEGHDVPPTAPETGDQHSGKAITPRMTLAQVAAAIGLGDDLLTGAPFRAGRRRHHRPALEPRRRRHRVAGAVARAGRRSREPASHGPRRSGSSTTPPGKVIDSHPLKLASNYQPARLWQMATVHGVECCAGDVLAFYRVASGDGTVVYEGMVPGGSSGGPDSTTFGGSYGSGPLVLPAGDYSITAWLAPYSGGVAGAPRGECSTQVTLRPLDDVALNADLPTQQGVHLPAGALAVAWLVGSDMARRATGRYASRAAGSRWPWRDAPSRPGPPTRPLPISGRKRCSRRGRRRWPPPVSTLRSPRSAS